MTVAHTRYMVVRWRDLPRWDVKTARASAFRLAHPGFRPLGDFAEEATELVRPWTAPEAKWPVYGVNNEVGVVFSHHQRGDTFNAPYKRIRKDWFFHNPTRANVGSLGRVPDVPAEAITSPEYQVWRITGDLLPAYVEILIQTSYFMEQIACHRVGAVKERLFVQNLLEIPVPVVPLTRQRKIVAAWEAARKSAAATAAKIERLESEIEARFLADLGLRAPEQTPLPKVFAVRWQDLVRWSVSFNALATTAIDLSTGRFGAVTLGELAAVSYGIQKCPANRPGQHSRPYLRVANVQRDELDLREVKYIDVPDKEFASFRLEPGDLLVCEGNSADLVGRPALWRGEIPDCVHQNHILRVRVDRSKAMPEYLLEYMSSIPARSHFRARAKFTTNLASINSNDLRELNVPLPPLTVQRQIVERVAKRREEIARLRADAKNCADAARASVEGMILGTKPIE
jgi:type I restriction enzyme S subunit